MRVQPQTKCSRDMSVTSWIKDRNSDIFHNNNTRFCQGGAALVVMARGHDRLVACRQASCASVHAALHGACGK